MNIGWFGRQHRFLFTVDDGVGKRKLELLQFGRPSELGDPQGGDDQRRQHVRRECGKSCERFAQPDTVEQRTAFVVVNFVDAFLLITSKLDQF